MAISTVGFRLSFFVIRGIRIFRVSGMVSRRASLTVGRCSGIGMIKFVGVPIHGARCWYSARGMVLGGGIDLRGMYSYVARSSTSGWM